MLKEKKNFRNVFVIYKLGLTSRSSEHVVLIRGDIKPRIMMSIECFSTTVDSMRFLLVRENWSILHNITLLKEWLKIINACSQYISV